MARGLGGPGSQLEPFAEILQAGVPQIAEAITERIWAEIPSYAALGDDADRERVRKAASRNVAAFVGALAEGKELTPEQIFRLGTVGEERAAQGIPLEDVLRAFRMVGRVLWEHLGRQLSNSSVPMEVTLRLGEALMRFTDRLSSAVAQHYLDAQRSILSKEEVARRDFLSDLLLGSYSSMDSMIESARGFGYDLLRHHFAVVAVPDSIEGDVSEESALAHALNATSAELSPSGRPLVGRRGGQTIALIGVPPRTDPNAAQVGELLQGELGSHWSMGVGGPHAGLEGCRRSYLEAREALEIGAIVDPTRKVYPFEDFLLYRFVRSDPELAERFVETVLGAVLQYDKRRRSDLIKSLEVYFAADESAKEAGRRLYAHPHTITYRLKQIERLAGRSLKNPEDKLHLQMAVKALRIVQGYQPEEAARLHRATS